MPDIRFEQKMMIDGKLVDGEAFRCVGRQNGVCGFDQYTEVKTMGYPAD